MPDDASDDKLIDLVGIAKRFGGVHALSGVDLHLRRGEVLALVGENGAGKSTLLKVLGGVHQPDAGTIGIDGQTVQLTRPLDSLDRGIAFIHQELSVLDNLDVAGNVFLGREPRRFGLLGLLDRGKMRSESRRYLERLGLRIDPSTRVAELSIAQRQLVEIARALSLNARVIIMDEPTSSLTLDETDRLLDVIAELRRQGVSIIYVSHRLGEIERIADRVTVLRDGRNAGALQREAEAASERITHDNMVRLMVGRDLGEGRGRPVGDSSPGEVVVRLDALRTRAFPQHAVSLDLRAGEIVGLAGLVGAGRSALVQTVFGVEPIVGGRVMIDGSAAAIRSPRDAIRERIFLVPEDRRGNGLVLDFSVRANTTLPGLSRHATVGLVRKGSERRVANDACERLRTKTASVETAAGNLSGGNQQKVVIGKWLALEDAGGRPVPPRLLLLDEPTRGIDVGAKAGIYELMRRLAEEGAAILMVSSDMEEVLGVSDRVAVMCEGRLTGVLPRAEATEDSVIRLAVRGMTEQNEAIPSREAVA